MEKKSQNLAEVSEASVYRRYAAAAQQREAALCCPIEYSADLLAVIPTEVIERDYGCGDPTPFVLPGETVLDLGAGGGKLCFIAAQVVGPKGRVIGVDCNREMLGLAKKHAPTVAERLGYNNVDFRYGMIQDLKLDLALLERELLEHPIQNAEDYLRLRQLQEELQRSAPLVADNSVDCVVSNCVLNLVRHEDRRQLFAEIARVLRPGGKAAISDIVSSAEIPEEMQRDPELWSGCISGAFREDEFLQAFERAGFEGIMIAKRSAEPWQTVNGIDFRSVTVVAYKRAACVLSDSEGDIIYRGPFKHVVDENGQTYHRGIRTPVDQTTLQRLMLPPYEQAFYAAEPIPAATTTGREPQASGDEHSGRSESERPVFQISGNPAGGCCGPDSSCC